ncbi:MAG: hypothetical protein NT069_25530 [Planctomycetota bacterium]|nr:hypothetical protein [Planctomycetota bacterium]
MEKPDNQNSREHDFTLVLNGISELNSEIESALYEAGCDDATLSVRFGVAFLTFSRCATSLKDAILSAIRDIRRARIGADVVRVDICDLVTQSDIARRVGRSRQLIHQYLTGQRGPKGFPAPACHITDGAPLWMWCEVARWLCANDMLKVQDLRDAEHVAMINSVLDMEHKRQSHPGLAEQILAAIS